jgi:hypothetical protein
MKITKRQLKRIIQQEKSKLLSEARHGGVGVGFAGWAPNKTADFAKAYGSEAQVIPNWVHNSNSIAELGISRVEDATRSPEHGLEVPVPDDRFGDVEALWGDVEGALDQLTTALSKMDDIDSQAASEAAKYVQEEIHDWRR